MNKEIFVQWSEINPEWKCHVVGTPDWRLSGVIFLINFCTRCPGSLFSKDRPWNLSWALLLSGPFSAVCSARHRPSECREDCTACPKVYGSITLVGVGKLEVLSVSAAWLSISTTVLTHVLHLTFLPWTQSFVGFPWLRVILLALLGMEEMRHFFFLHNFSREPLNFHEIMLQKIL